MTILTYLEAIFSWLFKSVRGHDNTLFTNGPAFASFPTPTFTVTSPDCGPSPAHFPRQYTQDGESRFPALDWSTAAAALPDVKEYLLISEDPDIPLHGSAVTRMFHGIYHSIPPQTTGVRHDDFEIAETGMETKTVRGGFKFVLTRYKSVYIGPRPFLGHGPHRYFFQVVALKEPLDWTAVGGLPTTKAQVAAAVQGKVLGWGMWKATYERKWADRAILA